MGKVTGFLEIERRDRGYEKPAGAPQDLAANSSIRCRARGRAAGRALHGLRHPLLSPGLPGQQPDPRLEQSGLSRPVARGARRRCTPPTISRNSPAASARRPARRPAPSTSTTTRSPSKPSSARSSTAAGRKAGSSRSSPPKTTGSRVAVVGSGPAGLACAQQLARAGHAVTLFEKSDRIGGLLRYGIPDFKMEKRLIDRRMAQMEAEGVTFRAGVEVGKDVAVEELLGELRRGGAVGRRGGPARPADAPAASCRASTSPWISSPSRTSAGPATARRSPRAGGTITAKGKHVVVIGGGDTGSDCIGTSNRQGAASVAQLEILAKPPERENKALVWPDWPLKLRTSSSQEEGVRARLGGATTARDRRERPDRGDGMRAAGVDDGRRRPHDDERSAGQRVHPARPTSCCWRWASSARARRGCVEQAGVDARRARQRARPTPTTTSTSVAKVFACGDMRRGQSLVVWAIREGRQCARARRRVPDGRKPAAALGGPGIDQT